MPKMKTHKATASRFRITRNGKVIRRTQGGGHLRRNKHSRMRRIYKKNVVGDVKSMRKMVRRMAPVVDSS
ncbi:MAG: 50S ribosomal protein L35 [Caldilineaceae bacterium SB0662_bin_9]|uniref:Large ribosomal subunit protein bL35 n=1 Tax=Caldilineaceae bacterium SB0662_bin_9 TaxID=2605258 RepID=A0A6B1DUK0_9CHLR|nr:50S ribosomal protein L35 [Caldilineaceae bacterium]MXZ25097.1 50S ribosomal protein L35 [Caldilineaceae bacterium SB0665_bin_21]MXZ43341.1 50S ribosomal protein L35 [Caldilineaceae bacterium SB0666_bin_21]MYA04313.1 50S ribosomal protein L35 [Caldilineaceae bacterium SB0664_bin_22]MYC63402.1 50S ribosomal protein L35 [Caldilineaceae bacterium SB0661_bin_34]MYD90054.1 50S ribosomal protein L35 [Caldilineaceae bacterium SB0662_bin_9]